jgi:hypothetical protein
MIIVDVGLVARPRILGPGASISLTVDPAGGLGTTKLNNANLTDKVSAVVDLTGTLTGGRLAMRSDISVTMDPSAVPTKIFVQTLQNTYEWGLETSYYRLAPWGFILWERTLTSTDELYGETSYGLPMVGDVYATATMTYPATVPAPPAPAPPAPPEDPGNFPMPVSGGIVVRALPGIAVSVDAPVITDGKPS